MRKYKKSYLLVLFVALLLLTARCKVAYCTEAEEEQQTDELLEEQEPATSEIIDYQMQPAMRIAVSETSYPNANNAYKELKTATSISRQGEYYFITDTYHNQVIYSNALETPITQWKVMTQDVELPHGVASDGDVYLALDTERDRVVIFEWKNGGFRNTQLLEHIGTRPHYIQYMPDEQAFYVWSSMTGDMYILQKNTEGIVCIKEVRHIYELEDQYVRSFSMMGDYILFPSGTNRYMILAKKDTFEVVERYPITDDIAGMAHVMYIDGYYYLSISTDYYADQSKAKLIRTPDLNSLQSGAYEDVSACFPQMGVPYYFERINGNYYLTNHGTKCAIYLFTVRDNTICNVGKAF